MDDNNTICRFLHVFINDMISDYKNKWLSNNFLQLNSRKRWSTADWPAPAGPLSPLIELMQPTSKNYILQFDLSLKCKHTTKPIYVFFFSQLNFNNTSMKYQRDSYFIKAVILFQLKSWFQRAARLRCVRNAAGRLLTLGSALGDFFGQTFGLLIVSVCESPSWHLT